MLMNECRNFWAEQEHNDHSNDHGSDHDLYIVCSSAGSNDAVKRKNGINKNDLNYCRAESQSLSFLSIRVGIFSFQFFMDLMNRFIDQKNSTAKHNQARNIKTFPKPG